MIKRILHWLRHRRYAESEKWWNEHCKEFARALGFRLSQEEMDRALQEAEPIPISEERIERIMEYVRDECRKAKERAEVTKSPRDRFIQKMLRGIREREDRWLEGPLHTRPESPQERKEKNTND